MAEGHAGRVGALLAAHDLDDLLYPPTPTPHDPGRVREYDIVASDQEVEILDALPSSLYAHIRLWRPETAKRSTQFRFNVEIMDANGKVCVTV